MYFNCFYSIFYYILRYVHVFQWNFHVFISTFMNLRNLDYLRFLRLILRWRWPSVKNSRGILKYDWLRVRLLFGGRLHYSQEFSNGGLYYDQESNNGGLHYGQESIGEELCT
jgi:hypothetical protein